MPADLFSQPAADGTRTVSEVVAGLKACVEDAFGEVEVTGELSNFNRARSGHCYFTLKDAAAQLDCVMWRGFTRYVFFEPQDGMLVRLKGSASVYERRGQLQLVAKSMRLAGEGALQQAFERLKKKLAAEGLFNAARKKPLPPFPEAIGLVTSGESAALQDLLSVLGRRFPQVRVLLRPVAVQGLGAAGQIAEAVAAFNAAPPDGTPRPDLLIVGRGGGSAEDLQAFNEEVVARAIAASEVPVISAVGHETDTSIADFVADARAATPSMAAEVAVPDRREVEALVRAFYEDLAGNLRQRLREARQRVAHLTASRAFHRPADLLRRRQQEADDLVRRLARIGERLTEPQRRRLEHLQARLDALDPKRPLGRGYAFVERNGQPVRQAATLERGDRVTLRFGDGAREAAIANADEGPA